MVASFYCDDHFLPYRKEAVIITGEKLEAGVRTCSDKAGDEYEAQRQSSASHDFTV